MSSPGHHYIQCTYDIVNCVSPEFVSILGRGLIFKDDCSRWDKDDNSSLVGACHTIACSRPPHLLYLVRLSFKIRVPNRSSKFPLGSHQRFVCSSSVYLCAGAMSHIAPKKSQSLSCLRPSAELNVISVIC